MSDISLKTFDSSLSSLIHLSHNITPENYLNDILKLSVMVTTIVTDISICSIWLIDENETPTKLSLKASKSIFPGYIKNRSLHLNEGVVGFVAAKQQTIVIGNVLEDSRFKEKGMARKLGLVSMLSIPMEGNEDKIIGVLNFFTTKAHTFRETEIKLMTTVAKRAAIVIMNTERMGGIPSHPGSVGNA